MKMVKKILLGLTAAAAVMTFVSCGQREEVGNAEMIDVNAGSSIASIDYTNEGDTLARGFKTLQNDHLDAIVHITNTINTIETPTNKLKANGVMGYIFNLKKDEETGKYNFSIAGVRYNQFTHKAEAYVETFKDVDGDKLEDELPTGIHASGDKTWSASDFGFELAAPDVSEGKIDVWIDVVANDGKSVGRGKDVAGSAGTYTVRFFGVDPVRKKLNNDGLEYKNTSATPLATLTIATSEVTHPYSSKLKDMEADIGFYANVTAGQKLTGEWKFDAIKMEAEEIEE